MSLVKFSNNYPMLIDRFFDQDLLNVSNKHFSKTNTTIPSVNIMEDDDGFALEMAVPGLKKEDFKIEVNNNQLVISSEKQDLNEQLGGNYLLREYYYQSFSRSFTLANTVNQDKIAASYEDGILKLSIPKKEEAKPRPIQLIDIA